MPAFSGLFAPYWRSDARGAIVGLSRFNTNAHLARATLEAICYQSRDVVEAMAKDSGVDLDVLKVDGGVTANKLCMQMQADILGVPVSKPVVAETTALGAAYAAGLAVGFWKDTEELARQLERGRALDPAVGRRPARGRATPAGRRPSSARSTGSTSSDGSSPNLHWHHRTAHGRPVARGPDAPRSSRWQQRGARRPRRRRRGRRHRLRAGRRDPRPDASAWSRPATGPSGTSSRSQQAAARRPALPRDARLRAGEGGAQGARPAPRGARAPPGAARARSSTRSPAAGWERPYVGSGIALYDVMAMVGAGRARGMPTHKHMTRRRALREAPCLKKESLTGAIQYYDGQIDDARHVDDDRAHGGGVRRACAPTASRVVDFLREGERVTGARLRDLETGRDFEVRAKQVINATGVWTDDTQGHGRRPRADQGPGLARASTWSCRATGSSRTTGLILRTEK